MAEKPMKSPSGKDRDERLAIPPDPETALRALRKVDPDARPAEGSDSPS